MLSKLVAVVGNTSESNLGLDEESSNVIADEVDVIVNSAANTTLMKARYLRYDTTININTRGPGRLMVLAKKCKNLELFLQVSTAYVKGQRQGRIMERPFNIGEIIARQQFLSKIPAKFLPKLDIEVFARSYPEDMGGKILMVFTKAMGEMMIYKLREDIPVVIIRLRPIVIESTFREPFPGWMEGNRMMDPIVLCYGKGQLTGFLVDSNGVLDVVSDITIRLFKRF
ncbi:hypothetical protein L6164_009493 [Bauhinia variegata]|uniref:Uncharacterized protein n=1 Tax=Bauhinia variegata TaxID=167791 RepID=A0ACB9PJX4_BAUVA|nr:hypothetical protein L6164_009493 [Bauhinia variegata]